MSHKSKAQVVNLNKALDKSVLFNLYGRTSGKCSSKRWHVCDTWRSRWGHKFDCGLCHFL